MPSGPRPDPPFRSIKLVFNGHLSDRTWANVMWLHANGDGVITVSDLEALAGDAGDPLRHSLHAVAVQRLAARDDTGRSVG